MSVNVSPSSGEVRAPSTFNNANGGTERPEPVLSYENRTLFRNGQRHRIIAGAMHYFRVHPEQWEDRIERLVAMGVNTLDTYVAWNFHQPGKDTEPDFTGWRDLGRFIAMAGDAGLDVIVRPGPYICAEWDNGGFPSWAISETNMVLRSSDVLFTDVVEDWFDHLLPVIAPLQACHGGPVIAVQIENEYGSYGDDQQYLRWNRTALQERGIVEMLFTADGGTDYFLDGGALPDTWATATLGSKGPEGDAVWKRRRPGEPFFTVEFWNGWFDHWGEEHHTRSGAEAADEARKILDVDGSICLYMAHGGTNFGLGSGANHDGVIQPTVTSYDSDAPISEDGRLTEKFHAMRKVFHAAEGRKLPALPEHLSRPAPVLPAASIALSPGRELLEFLRSFESVSSVKPRSFEELGLDRGLVHYSATAVLPIGGGTIRIRGLHDRALVWVDGAFAGILTDANAVEGLQVASEGGPAHLEILVENQGRINYGPYFGQGKGMLDGVVINQRYVFHWEQRPIGLDMPLEQLLALADATGTVARDTEAAGFFHGTFDVAEPADTYLALPEFGKGFVWVNGFMLGRYWGIGPQLTLYVPAPLLTAGKNRITVLELERGGTHAQLRQEPELGVGGVTYVEDLG